MIACDFYPDDRGAAVVAICSADLRDAARIWAAACATAHAYAPDHVSDVAGDLWDQYSAAPRAVRDHEYPDLADAARVGTARATKQWDLLGGAGPEPRGVDVHFAGGSAMALIWATASHRVLLRQVPGPRWEVRVEVLSPGAIPAESPRVRAAIGAAWGLWDGEGERGLLVALGREIGFSVGDLDKFQRLESERFRTRWTRERHLRHEERCALIDQIAQRAADRAWTTVPVCGPAGPCGICSRHEGAEGCGEVLNREALARAEERAGDAERRRVHDWPLEDLRAEVAAGSWPSSCDIGTIERRLAACEAALRLIGTIPIAFHGRGPEFCRDEMARVAGELATMIQREREGRGS